MGVEDQTSSILPSPDLPQRELFCGVMPKRRCTVQKQEHTLSLTTDSGTLHRFNLDVSRKSVELRLSGCRCTCKMLGPVFKFWQYMLMCGL
jgi:hypothetical protein